MFNYVNIKLNVEPEAFDCSAFKTSLIFNNRFIISNTLTLTFLLQLTPAPNCSSSCYSSCSFPVLYSDPVFVSIYSYVLVLFWLLLLIILPLLHLSAIIVDFWNPNFGSTSSLVRHPDFTQIFFLNSIFMAGLGPFFTVPI